MGRNGQKQSHAIVSLTSPGSKHGPCLSSLVRHSLQSQKKWGTHRKYTCGIPEPWIRIEFGRLDSDPEPGG